ncbi:MAG: murein biosynthesis integral membrane protein MurJ [Chlamydiae bacterium]|nr:murein biosynthesis integral membrane protein MurJ [Chlamydiota bacterium]MBI3266312.1 murein biosynthesis integral membrane protein MurJ [Chlamydiota bacterium]
MSEKLSMARSMSRVGFWTFTSRLLGLVRDSMVARLFGVGFATDAFMVAFTIPNLLRRLLAEGALSIAFVPIFTDSLTRQRKEDSQDTFQAIFTIFSALLILISILGVFFSPFLVKVFAPGFEIEKFHLTVLLNRLMFPFIFLMGSSSVAMGLLNALNSFSVPAAAPILLNVCMILSSFLFYRFLNPPILALGWGVLAGGVTQWLLQVWKVGQFGFKVRFSWDWKHPGLQRVFRLMAPTVFGVAVYHLNILVSRALASLLPQGSVTYLYYSDRFLEFPLGIFAFSIATVALPQLSREAASGNDDRLKETLFFALRLASFICIPAMFGLMMLRLPILSLVFQYGKFSLQNTLELAQVFGMASLGLIAVAGLRIVVQAFYSMGDVKTPVKAACASFLVNASLGFVLMRWLGPSGLTLSSSIAAWVQWLMLFWFLGRRVGKISFGIFFREIWPILLASLVMALVIWPLGGSDLRFFPKTVVLKLAYVLGAVAVGAGIYMGLVYLFGFKELRGLIKKLRAREERLPVAGPDISD